MLIRSAFARDGKIGRVEGGDRVAAPADGPAQRGLSVDEHKRAGKHTVRGEADPWPLYEEITHIPLLVCALKERKTDRIH